MSVGLTEIATPLTGFVDATERMRVSAVDIVGDIVLFVIKLAMIQEVAFALSHPLPQVIDVPAGRVAVRTTELL